MIQTIAFLAGTLIPTFLLSRLALWLTRRVRPSYRRLLLAHAASLLVAGVIGGFGFAKPGEGFVFMRAIAAYVMPQVIWLAIDAWRYRQGQPELMILGKAIPGPGPGPREE